MIFSETEAVATRLGYARLMIFVATSAWPPAVSGTPLTVTVRAARQALPPHRVLSFIKRERKPDYIKADHGLIISSGEVGLAEDQPQRSPRWPPSRGAGAQRGWSSPP